MRLDSETVDLVVERTRRTYGDEAAEWAHRWGYATLMLRTAGDHISRHAAADDLDDWLELFRQASLTVDASWLEFEDAVHSYVPRAWT